MKIRVKKLGFKKIYKKPSKYLHCTKEFQKQGKKTHNEKYKKCPVNMRLIVYSRAILPLKRVSIFQQFFFQNLLVHDLLYLVHNMGT